MPTAIHRFPQHLINVFYQYLALQNIKNYKYITKVHLQSSSFEDFNKLQNPEHQVKFPEYIPSLSL